MPACRRLPAMLVGDFNLKPACGSTMSCSVPPFASQLAAVEVNDHLPSRETMIVQQPVSIALAREKNPSNWWNHGSGRAAAKLFRYHRTRHAR